MNDKQVELFVPSENFRAAASVTVHQQEAQMGNPALESMDYDELTALIDEATKMRAEKFESSLIELEQKMREQENEIEAERLEGAVPPDVN